MGEDKTQITSSPGHSPALWLLVMSGGTEQGPRTGTCVQLEIQLGGLQSLHYGGKVLLAHVCVYGGGTHGGGIHTAEFVGGLMMSMCRTSMSGAQGTWTSTSTM